MLKGLGLAKKRAPSEVQIQKHREQLMVHNQWKKDLAKIQDISQKLDRAYQSHKGDFALGRYEELKGMIKDAIKEYHDVMEKTKKQSLDSATSAIADKYRSGGQGPTYQSGGQSQAPAPSQKSPSIFSKIKDRAAALTGSSSNQPNTGANGSESKHDMKDREMLTWGYEGMNAKQVEEETETMRKEVLQLKQDFRRERDKYDRLAKEYEDSKKHAPPQRFNVMKCMVKDMLMRK